MRKLVTVRQIDEIHPIEGADAIVRARIGGWDVVVKKDEFTEGGLCVYFEIDSFLPESDYRYQFLMDRGKIMWNGHHGARLKTIKLRGQISQGLALPANDFPEVEQAYNGIPQDQDFSELLNVLKWEPIIPAQLAGQMRGNFPHFLCKTDQERAQNMVRDIFEKAREYEVTTKLEGSSMTVYMHEGRFGVCSRNIDLKTDNDGNAFVSLAKKIGLDEHLPDGFAIQGELMGPGVQGNIEGFNEPKFFVFDVYNIADQKYLRTHDRVNFVLDLKEKGLEIDHVPVIAHASLEKLGIETIDDLLAYADGPSINFKYREGVVFKDLDDPNFTFKAISNKYLMKT